MQERSSKRTRDEFDARDLWTAAWLHANKLPFRRCYRYGTYMRWVFGCRQAAWDLSYQWRDGATDAMVHGPTLMVSYKQMALAARAASFMRASGREVVEQQKDDDEHDHDNDYDNDRATA